MILGHTNKLQFEIRLSEQDKALGRGTLGVRVGKSLIWSDEAGRGVGWTWIDLLEQLARSWPFLKYEESAPPGTYDGMLSLLRKGHFPSTDFDFEPAPESTRETYIFLRRHNLATGIEGLYLPSLSLLREGRKVWVASLNVVKLLDFAETLHTLSELGDMLAAHISSASEQDRARLAVEAWRNREPPAEAALQIQLGSSRSASEWVPPGETLVSYFEAQNAEEYASSLLIAARMSDALPLENRRKILELIRALPSKGVSELLEETSTEAESVLPNYVQRAFEQGQKLAQWARRKFGFAPESRSDPQDVLRRLGVDVTLHHCGIDAIDAVGSWGHQHGPAVLVNLDGKHAQSIHGRRATLAHELAHVLVDRNGSLPAAEVFGGNVPRHPEQRANAFAAEFLLPKNIAVERIRNAANARDAIEQLREQFEVSRELAAWQITNSAAYHTLGDSEKALLRSWTAGTESALFF